MSRGRNVEEARMETYEARDSGVVISRHDRGEMEEEGKEMLRD